MDILILNSEKVRKIKEKRAKYRKNCKNKAKTMKKYKKN